MSEQRLVSAAAGPVQPGPGIGCLLVAVAVEVVRFGLAVQAELSSAAGTTDQAPRRTGPGIHCYRGRIYFDDFFAVAQIYRGAVAGPVAGSELRRERKCQQAGQVFDPVFKPTLSALQFSSSAAITAATTMTIAATAAAAAAVITAAIVIIIAATVVIYVTSTGAAIVIMIA